MSFTTVLPTAKLAFSTLAENVSVPEPPARVAESISTSEGELTREGTLPEAGGRVQREDVVHLDLNLLDILQGRSRGDQPGNCGPVDDCGLLQNEVIGRLRLEFPRAGTPGRLPPAGRRERRL